MTKTIKTFLHKIDIRIQAAIILLIGSLFSALIIAKCSNDKDANMMATGEQSVITQGDQNTIFNSSGGDINLNQGVKKEDVIAAFQETIKDLQKENTTVKDEVSALKERLAKIHNSAVASLPEESNRWAISFIESIPIRKDKIDAEIKKRNERDDSINNSIPYLFDYMVSFVDKRMTALKRSIPGIEIEEVNIETYFVEKNIARGVIVRHVQFPNGNSFAVKIQLGLIEKGIIIERPTFSWGKLKCSDCVKFYSKGICYGGFGAIPHCYLTFFNDEYELDIDKVQSTLSRQFDRLIEDVYLKN